MKKLILVATAVLACATFTSAPADAQPAGGDVVVAHHHHHHHRHHHHAPVHHSCTRTSSGSCIQGGEFCPQASYGQSGWDARGRRYVCKGDHTHPHWMIP